MITVPKKLRCCLTVLCSLIALSLLPNWNVHAANANPSGPGSELQALIDRTAAGSTLVLAEGSYRGPVVINKPMNVQGQGKVEITGGNDEAPVIQIAADGVALRNVAAVQPAGGDAAAVLVTGNEAVLDSLIIRTRSFGIVLRDSGRHVISDADIQRLSDGGQTGKEVKLSDKRNGIDLYNSHGNRIRNNRISGMNDGIYLESSDRNNVENNRVDRSRYGIHCMYTNDTVVRDNYGEYNVTGAMIMGVQAAEVTGNTFAKQSENVNSQGLLLFDVRTSRIVNNKVEGNRVGLYIEQSHRNEFERNEVVQNFVGIQFLESNDNRFMNNRFIGNVIPAEANESGSNRFERNYWDEFRGIDTNGDGLSELAYAMNPFFQRLTSATPAFQLFFQSPGMQFLESMQSAGKEQWTTDTAPLMRPENGQSAAASSPDNTGSLAVGLALLVLSITIMTYTGVKRA